MEKEKKLKDKIKNLRITLTVLGSITIATTVAFGIYWSKFRSAERSLDGVNNATYTEVIMHKGSTVESKYYELHGEKTLLELFEHHSADFGLKASSWGKYLETVFGNTLPKSQFWELRSASVILHHPELAAAATWAGDINPHTLTVGAKEIPLTSSEVFDIYAVDIKASV